MKVDWPILCNLRLDPFERTSAPGASLEMADWFKYEFWRFVFVQEVVEKFAMTFLEFPPLQKPASFNMDAMKEQLKAAIQAHHSA